MSYCINPWCADRKNADSVTQCQTCGTALLIQGRYRLIQPLRELDEWESTEIFEIDDSGQKKVLKILKKASCQPQFEREVRTLQHLKHSGIPAVSPDGHFSLKIGDRPLHCLVMEKIQGPNLDDWLQKNGSIDQSQAINWMRQLVKVLGQLHGEGLFHRDIKLSNIMLRPSGQLVLVDFGTVRIMSGTYFAKISCHRDITSVVSPGYTPLEQINGKAVPQSDFYALGRSLIYLLTAQHPIDLPENETTGQIEWRGYSPHPVTDGFAQLLDDMMAPFLAQRPLNAEAILTRLNLIEKKDSQKQTWLRWLIIANIIFLLLNIWLGWQWTKEQWQKPESSSAALIEPTSRSSLTGKNGS